jgi:hypothetical protein
MTTFHVIFTSVVIHTQINNIDLLLFYCCLFCNICEYNRYISMNIRLVLVT